MARLLLLDIVDNDVKEVECNHLDDYYKYLRCDCFDIANRELGGKRFDIFVDDEGLLKDNPIVSAISPDHEPMLVGNLIFANHDSQGNTTSLSNEDIIHIKKYIFNMLVLSMSQEAHHRMMIVGLEY